ncbi:glycosyltransferase family 4 protein [Patescibacteria group bacterium]
MGSDRQEKINILYHTSRYDQKFAKWDAVGQEVTLLAKNYGNLIFAHATPRTANLLRFVFRLPAFFEKLYCHKAFSLDKKVDLHHVFYPRLRDFRYLRYLKKPIIYTVVSEKMGYSSEEEMIREVRKMDYVKLFVVACEKDKDTLQKAGIKNVTVVMPGVNLDRFLKVPPVTTPPKNFLMLTPPTSLQRFENRGVNLILETISRFKDLKVTFLWRDVAYKEMIELVQEKKLEEQVEIVNQLIKPEEYLAKSAGAIAVFTETEGNKAYPNSIIESLATSRPVIVSSVMPIAEIIQKNRCGVIVKPDVGGLSRGIQEYFRNYKTLAKNCQKTAMLFSEKRLLKDYQNIYQRIS